MAELKLKPIDESIRSLGGNYRLLLDLIQHDDEIKPALQFVCGNCVYCENLNEARYVFYILGM